MAAWFRGIWAYMVSLRVAVQEPPRKSRQFNVSLRSMVPVDSETVMPLPNLAEIFKAPILWCVAMWMIQNAGFPLNRDLQQFR
jgi:hypothetical protein